MDDGLKYRVFSTRMNGLNSTRKLNIKTTVGFQDFIYSLAVDIILKKC